MVLHPGPEEEARAGGHGHDSWGRPHGWTPEEEGGNNPERHKTGASPHAPSGTLRSERVLLAVVLVGRWPLGWWWWERVSPEGAEFPDIILSRSLELALLARVLHSLPF